MQSTCRAWYALHMIKTPSRIVVSLAVGLLGVAPQSFAQSDNIGHERHLHRHNQPHDTVKPGTSRFITSRDGAPLVLPVEDDAFTFAIIGDRTGGPAEGVAILADAVRDINLIEPDLVMSVGDLINGYNETPQWMEQMHEFKGIMNQLLCPWFPVAGNHDVYWRDRGRGETKPEGEHEASYEMHFGPLWYAFEHKNNWFIVLYSDEGNPETGEKNFSKPEAQKMSPEQFEWLKATLQKATDAEHVFVFLHHPRWLGGGYGDDWDRVHDLLVSAGNVAAVFAGHIHRMRYDGPKDGIEYVTLATTGGGQSERVPEAGYLHHFHLVTVRKNQIALAALPVGEVMDVRELTGDLVGEASRLVDLTPTYSRALPMDEYAGVSDVVTASITNPISRPIEVAVLAESDDSRWVFWPDHLHKVIGPGETFAFEFQASRPAGGFDAGTRLMNFQLSTEILAEGFRYSIPAQIREVPVDVELQAPVTPARDMAIRTGATRHYLAVPNESLEVPQGPQTLETWLKADKFSNRTGLICKTENSEYGIFVNSGTPSYSIHIDGRYIEARGPDRSLKTDTWHHIAGVYDEREVRLYVDGKLVATTPRDTSRRETGRTTNSFPLMIGADVDGRGNPTSGFDGLIDGVRLSSTARYTGERFDPAARPASDADTLLLLNMDGRIGPWVYDESDYGHHPRIRGSAQVVEAGR